MGDEKNLEIYVMGSKRGFAVIKYAGILDFLQVLAQIRSWLARRYYDVTEKEHTEAVKPSGKEVEMELEADRKISDYVKFKINIKIKVLRSIEVLVETDQGKERKQQAEIDVWVRAWIQKNYKGTFKKKEISKVQDFFRQIYERFIAKPLFDSYKKKLADESLDLVDIIKETLEMPRR